MNTRILNLSLILSFILGIGCSSGSQVSVSSNAEKVSNISFSNGDFWGASEMAITDEFTLNQDQFLGMHFDLEKSLLASLKDIDPTMSDEQLLSNGNFQFVFKVNQEVVFTHNLNAGAGSADNKKNKLEYNIPLIYSEQIDFWGWFMWLRFYKMAGGEDVLESGNHKLAIEVRSYVQGEDVKVGKLLAKGEIAVAVKEIPYEAGEDKIQAIESGAGWAISKDNYDKSKIETLNRKIAQGRFIGINGLVVIKDHELLIEEYFNGSDRSTQHDARSVGKTIAASMLGIAINDGHIKNEFQQLSEFYNLKDFENYAAAKDHITLKSLVTMSSNLLGTDEDYDSPGHEERMYPTDNWVKFTLDLPIDAEKKMEKDFHYFTAGVVVLGDVIHKSVPGGLIEYADKKLFGPLGITPKWQLTPQGVGNTAGGLQLRALDFAKWGQVYKNGGTWNGQRLIPENWVRKSLTDQVDQKFDPNGAYGYLVWNNVYTVDGVTYPYSAWSGNGGNKIFVFKSLPLVIVVNASAYGAPFAHMQVDQMMERYILPAVID